VADGEASLQSGVLLLSRLAWLLRSSQGTFLEHALQVQLAPTSDSSDSSSPSRSSRGAASKPTHTHHHQQYMTSLEQLQSAFDIADTDGDGVVTFAEAMEVSQSRAIPVQCCIVILR
jgi:hypothetical protein